MQRRARGRVKRTPKFFYLGLSHDSLVNHYKLNFAMMQHHNYSLTELEYMLPWEREIYVALLQEHIKEESERLEEQKRKRRR